MHLKLHCTLHFTGQTVYSTMYMQCSGSHYTVGVKGQKEVEGIDLRPDKIVGSLQLKLCILYTVYSVNYKVYTRWCKCIQLLSAVQCTVYSVHLKLNSVQCTVT